MCGVCSPGKMWAIGGLNEVHWMAVSFRFGSLSIWWFCSRSYTQQHVIQYRFVPKKEKRKKRRNKRNRNVISMDRRQQLCASASQRYLNTKYSNCAAYDKCRSNESVQAQMISSRALKNSFVQFRPAMHRLRIAETNHRPDKHTDGAGTIFFRLPDMTQLINKIIWGETEPAQTEHPTEPGATKTKKSNPDRFRRMRGPKPIRRDCKWTTNLIKRQWFHFPSLCNRCGPNLVPLEKWLKTQHHARVRTRVCAVLWWSNRNRNRTVITRLHKK